MVGGGNRRDEGSFTVNNTNVFAALDSLRKKKKSDKEKGSSKGGKGTSKETKGAPEAEKQVYWAPAPLPSKSWADIDDEDDDDYYATTAPPQAVWGASGSNKAEETQKHDPVEVYIESESEDDLLDEGDDDVEEEQDPEPEAEQPPPVLKNPVEASPAPKETERQLSKKERKKKELADLDAILADFGVNPKGKDGDERSDSKDRKEGQTNGDADKDNNTPAEPKSAKKKKKKDKSSKDTKEPQDQPNTSNVPGETAGAEHTEGGDASAVDVKEKLKKMASAKKKKSSKEMDAAARAAAAEAAARSSRLAAAKKKEKNHYNQQPMR